MEGSKSFGPSKDFPRTSAPSGKPILIFDPTKPVNFIDLADTIAAYTGHAGKFLVVNQTETGVSVVNLDSILDAISTLNDQFTAIFDADPLVFGKDIDMEQFEMMGFRLEQIAGNPSTPVNGQLWYDTVAGYAKVYQNNAVMRFFTQADADLLDAIDILTTEQGDDITDLTNLLTNIADDGILSKGEKPVVVKEYNTIIAEKSGIDASAVLNGVTSEKTTYDNAVIALTNYLTNLSPAYNDYDTDTVIDRNTFIAKFTDVYTARQIVFNKINENLFDALQVASQEASDANNVAIQSAADALLAMNEITDMGDDGILSKDEKIKLILQVSIITTEQAGIDAEAVEHEVTGTPKTNYDSAVTALTVYLDTIAPDWDNITASSEIVRNDFNTAFANLYSTRQILLNAIARAAMDEAKAASEALIQIAIDAAQALEDAAAAQAAAEAAEGHAQEAIGDLTDISNDDLLTPGEKPLVVKEYGEITAEQSGIDDEATRYTITTEKTNYDTAVSALGSYLATLTTPVLWNNYAGNTTIARTTFIAAFQHVYSDRQILLNKISQLTHEKAEELTGDLADANAAFVAAESDMATAAANATTALGHITAIANDNLLSITEKPEMIRRYNEILAEKTGLDAKATFYEITTEKTTYDSAISTLTSYLSGLTTPVAWNVLTGNTTIVGATFNGKFQDVYDARNELYQLIYDKASDAATVAAWESADSMHRSRTKTIIDEGLVTTGRLEVGNVAYGDNNAGISGFITPAGSPSELAADIRFWAGQNYIDTLADRTTCPFYVTHDGTLHASKALIAESATTPGQAWIIDTDAIYTGTKKVGGGFAANGITLSNDGSLHAKNFYLNANGDAAFSGTVTALGGAIGGWNITDGAIYTGTLHTANGFNDENEITLCSDGSIHAKNFYIDSDGTASFKGKVNDLKSMSYTIEAWDMNHLTNGLNTISIPHNLADFTKVRTITVLVINDSLTQIKELVPYENSHTSPTQGVDIKINSTDIIITIYALNETHANWGSYESTSNIRGWITLEYLDV